jgi:plastocyanin
LLLVFICLFFNIQASALTIKIKVLDPSKSEIKGLIVYLTAENQTSASSLVKQPLVISQNNKKFIPYLAVLQKGQAINFKNQDDVTHHIYSVSGENRFDFKIKAGEEKRNNTIESVGEVAMGCNIHDWMSGYALVVDTPYFSKTDVAGTVVFEEIPAGHYKLTVWHPQLETKNNEFTKAIEVQSNKSFTIILPRALLVIPEQQNQDEFDFLEGY